MILSDRNAAPYAFSRAHCTVVDEDRPIFQQQNDSSGSKDFSNVQKRSYINLQVVWPLSLISKTWYSWMSTILEMVQS